MRPLAATFVLVLCLSGCDQAQPDAAPAGPAAPPAAAVADPPAPVVAAPVAAPVLAPTPVLAAPTPELAAPTPVLDPASLTVEAVCDHVFEVMEKELEPLSDEDRKQGKADCVAQANKEKAARGDAEFGRQAACIMKGTKVADLQGCK